MKLVVLEGEKFSCHSCTNCCRDWHVELMPGEAERIVKLKWDTGDPLSGGKPLLEHAGRSFLAHKENGACRFLNETNGRCRIHEKFGMQAKPAGCRLFPFQITPTFKGEASVTARFDCPTVRKNEGSPHESSLPELRRLAGEVGVSDGEGFDDLTRCLLDREQITGVTDFVLTLMGAFARDDQRAVFIFVVCDWLHATDVRELTRPALVEAYPRLIEEMERLTSGPVRPPAWIHRLAFRSLLSLYLRRDEDVLNNRASRLSRTLATAAVVLGGGSFQKLGLSHPAGRVRDARLFSPSHFPHNPAVFPLFWRVIKVRLESYQFMGRGNHGRNFLEGLRSLALLYPLVMATAKYRAASRGGEALETQDVEYGVATIEHSFGRMPILNEPLARQLLSVLMERDAFVRLARSI